MAFLAYFGALSAMGAFLFGLSILLEPSPGPSSSAKRVVAEQTVKTPLPPRRPVAVKPTDETVTEPTVAVTSQVMSREDDEAAPNAVAAVPPTQDIARSAMASAAPAEAVAPPVAVEKPKVKKTLRNKKAPAKTIADTDGDTRRLRYVGVRDGIPTYMVER